MTPLYPATPSIKSYRGEVKTHQKTGQSRNIEKKQEEAVVRLSDLKKPKTANKSKTPVKTMDPAKKGSSKKVEIAPQKATTARN
jgi:hypothetical protein